MATIRPTEIKLTEYTTTANVPLTLAQRDALHAAVRTLTITPTAGTNDHYDLTPSGTVGVLRIGDLQVEFAPRLSVERVLFLVSYALDPRRWREADTEVAPDRHLIEAIVPTFIHHARRALRRGLLHGYMSIEETHTTIRGRIRIADQLRSRPGQHLPVELLRDDFTANILENQLLLAATERLTRLPLRNDFSRISLRELRDQFLTVSPATFAPGRIPEPHWTRLNDRYKPAVRLARFILSGDATNLSGGLVTASGVLFDMALVFENFVVEALREALGLSARSFSQGATGRGVKLDRDGAIPLKPDLSWWVGDACVFAGDCKYKRAAVDGIPNADLYQLLAYTTALGLDEGLLIYAAGEHSVGAYTTLHSGKRLGVRTLNLAGEPSQVLEEIADLALEIRRIARRNGRGFSAA